MDGDRDLRDELTVFVLTVGAPSFPECLRRLAAQDCRFTRDVIDHVAPMSNALQCMLDRCRTPVFVQLDEDMLLSPHAIRSLYARRRRTSPSSPAICSTPRPRASSTGSRSTATPSCGGTPIASVEACDLMGILAGRLAPVDGGGREKDYREYDRLPGFAALVEFVTQAGKPPEK